MYTLRKARPDDAARITELLQLARWEDPTTALLVGRALALGVVPRSAGLLLTLVADSGTSVDAVLLASPPSQWIEGLAALGTGAQAHMARRVVDLEQIIVAPPARGGGLGHTLISAATETYRDRGYRLMSGSFYADQEHLERYYTGMGFTVLPAGQPLRLFLPLPGGSILHYPAEPRMRQMGRPLAPAVGVRPVQSPDGLLAVIDNVL